MMNMNPSKSRDNLLCHACNYSLRGLDPIGLRCPECGILNPLTDPSSEQQRLERQKRISRISSIAGVPVVVIVAILTCLMAVSGSEFNAVAEVFLFGPAFLGSAFVFAGLAELGQGWGFFIGILFMGLATAIQFKFYIIWAYRIFDKKPNHAHWYLAGSIILHILCGFFALTR